MKVFISRPRVIRRVRRRVKKPKWTFILIGICTTIFILDGLFNIWPYFSFVPSRAFQRPWTFITSIFLHAGLSHWFLNMFALFMFGLYLESRVSTRKYLTIFLLAGVMGNLAYWIGMPSSSTPAMGASGAIYGIMGVLAVLFPKLIVYVGFAPMPITFAAVMWFLLEFTGMFVPSNIAHEAHLAGLIFGVAYGFYLRKKRNKVVFFWEK